MWVCVGRVIWERAQQQEFPRAEEVDLHSHREQNSLSFASTRPTDLISHEIVQPELWQEPLEPDGETRLDACAVRGVRAIRYHRRRAPKLQLWQACAEIEGVADMEHK